jgi:pyruvate dehydrogenase E1 component
LGSVRGHRVRSLGVDAFGQTGSVAELYKTYGLDAQSILQAAENIAPGRPIRYIKSVRE